MIAPANEDAPTWPKTVAIGFATALAAAIATKTGEWAVETIRKRFEKKPTAEGGAS